jgi:restriction system protein
MAGRSAFYVDIEHEGLQKFRRVTGSDTYVVQRKAIEQKLLWDDQWRRRCQVQDGRNARLSFKMGRDAKKAEAEERTVSAQRAVADFRNLLASTLEKHDAIVWESLRDTQRFSERQPERPERLVLPPKPDRSSPDFQPKLSLLAYVFASIRNRKKDEAEAAFALASRVWENSVANMQEKYDAGVRAFEHALKKWNDDRAAFEQRQADGNKKIEELAAQYMAKDADAVIEYVDMVMSSSEYPDCFPKEWSVDYLATAGMLVVDYELPPVEAVPSLKAVKYVQSRDVLEEQLLKDNDLAQLYDDALYQTCLRTVHEVFESDSANAIQAVTFNGWVRSVDRASGNPIHACIMSLQASKAGFAIINLRSVDPKACFRSLKGVGGAKLSGMSAVVPILRLDKTDARFVAAQMVIGDLDQSTNVAAISWEEFEHLVREIFEKEFSANGGEVKVTRASRDGGVDAIAFDPDPLRGGKIVIQAKRYTGTVGVSAVRDLYGTVVNEGATKGILVTTSQYGPDAYAFAKDKPLTLLDGGNLLHLLQKHGHPARIDLAEAKRLLAADRAAMGTEIRPH